MTDLTKLVNWAKMRATKSARILAQPIRLTFRNWISDNELDPPRRLGALERDRRKAVSAFMGPNWPKWAHTSTSMDSIYTTVP